MPPKNQKMPRKIKKSAKKTKKSVLNPEKMAKNAPFFGTSPQNTENISFFACPPPLQSAKQRNQKQETSTYIVKTRQKRVKKAVKMPKNGLEKGDKVGRK